MHERKARDHPWRVTTHLRSEPSIGSSKWRRRVGKKGTAMATDGYDAEPSPSAMMAGSWQAGMLLGALTLILGIVVTFHPTGSLNVIAVLLGIMMILSGLFHLIRIFDREEMHRVWTGIAGLMFVVVGVVLIRHLHLTRALIG